MKKIIALLLAFMLVFSLTAALSACGEDEPVVEDPTTEDPTTEDPTTEEPTTEDPTEEDPTTEEPTVEEPTTEDPTTEEPTVEEPTTEDPTTEEPTVEEPTTEDPTTEEPTVEEPTTEEPTEEDPTEEPTPDEPTADNSSDVVLIKNGKAFFNFVVPEGYTSNLNKTIDTLVSDLAKFGLAVERVADNADTITECEVLIGTVQTRGDEYKLDPHVYGWDGYTVQIVNGKIVILGGSDESLYDAINAFKEKILGITKKTKVLTDATMTLEQNIEKIQTGYKIDSITVAGNDFKSYKIVADSKVKAEYTAAAAVQELIYKKTGWWLDIIAPGEEYEKAFIIDLTDAKTCKSDKGFILEIKDGNILVDCGFANKIEEACLAFVMTEITNTGTPSVVLNNNLKYEKVDYKNIYYKDFGAVGDGYTDDFMAIKACHDQANEFGHTVHATAGHTYYFGEGSGYNSIYVRTDTYWHGCSFIFDDSHIDPPPRDENGKGTGKKGDPEFYTSIFILDSLGVEKTYTKLSLPISSLYEGATNIGFAPGFRALVRVYNSNVKQFIRYGANADNGASQTEILMVEADGTIDPTTPVQWNYEVITQVNVYQRDDAPITLSGADDGKHAHVETIFNGAPSYYDYYERNIMIRRSNAVVKNIKHTITGEAESPTGAPYGGFISIEISDNIVVAGCEFQCPKGYSTMGTGGSMASMGSYELTATASNNILWRDCTQSNFYKPDGSVPGNGMMGTNYCKNLAFDNMVVCSFDAHKGTYNATLKNSYCEHINFIGEGTITLENMVIYVGPKQTGLVFRSDYGSTWQGDVVIDGLDLRYPTTMSDSKKERIQLIKTEWNNHYFGYQTYLPHTITMKNVTTSSYTVEVFGDKRVETKVDVNKAPLHLYINLESYKDYDISDPNANITTQDKLCECGFTDADNNKRCDNCNRPETSSTNTNPFMPTEKVYIENCPGLTMIFPKTPQFRNMRVFVDGEEVDWYSTGSIKIPKN